MATRFQSLSAYSPDGLFFAAVSEDGHLRVWDTIKGEVKIERPANLKNMLTALAWEAPQKEKRKRKKVTKSQIGHVVLGFSSGSVALFDISTGTASEWTGEHSGPVASALWHPETKSVYTGGKDGAIISWDPIKGQVTGSLKADTSAVTALCVGQSHDGHPTLVSAGASIRLWDLESNTTLKTLPGHTSAISGLVASPLASFKAVFSFVSHREADTQVNAWTIDPKSRKRTPLVTLDVPQCPSSVSIAPVSQKKNETLLRVAVLSEEGLLYLYDVDTEAQHRKPVQAQAKLEIRTGDTPSVRVHVLQATFGAADSSAAAVAICRGSPIFPVFEAVDLTQGGSDPLADISLTREAPIGFFTDSARQGGVTATSGDGRSKGSKSSGSASQGSSKQRPTVVSAAQVVTGTSETDTFAARLDEVVKEAKIDKLPTGYTRDGMPRSGTLANMLLQALHSGDQALLDECLSSSSERIVAATVKRIPTKFIVPFFRKVVHKLEARPSRAATLLTWVRNILTLHASYLINMPEMHELIRPLYGMVEARLANARSVTRLSGRLKMLLAAGAKSSLQGGSDDEDEDEADALTPAAVYIEPDSGDDDDEEDDEEGSDDENEWVSMDAAVEEEDNELLEDIVGLPDLDDVKSHTSINGDASSGSSDDDGNSSDDSDSEEDGDAFGDEEDDDDSEDADGMDEDADDDEDEDKDE